MNLRTMRTYHGRTVCCSIWARAELALMYTRDTAPTTTNPTAMAIINSIRLIPRMARGAKADLGME